MEVVGVVCRQVATVVKGVGRHKVRRRRNQVFMMQKSSNVSNKIGGINVCSLHAG